MRTGSAAAAPLAAPARAPHSVAITPAKALETTIARRANVSAASPPSAQRSSERADTYAVVALISGCSANVAAAKNAAHSIPGVIPGVRPGSDLDPTLVRPRSDLGLTLVWSRSDPGLAASVRARVQ